MSTGRPTRAAAAIGARVVVVGLGPAGPGQVTLAADEALRAAPLVYLRTARHPAAAAYLALGARPLDHHYEQAATFADAYAAIVEELVAAARTHGRVAYAVPGSPAVLESAVAALYADERVTVELIAGMSFLDLCWSALGIDPVAARVRLLDGELFATDAADDLGPFLVTQLWRRDLLSQMKLAVEEPPDEPVVILHHLGLDDERIVEAAWDDLDRVVEPDHLTSVFVPALRAPVGIELARLQAVVDQLRLECPWDRVQTHRSLVRHLLEESYEVIEAIDELEAAPEDAGAGAHLEEELGDLLCQVLFHSVLGREEGLFDLRDVARTVHDKLVRRHPHVFGETGPLADAESVLSRWEEIKRDEKGRESLMDGIPAALPGLLLATKIERKAAGAGLGAAVEPVDGADVLIGVTNDLGDEDVDVAGELLFALARRVAAAGIDPEDALRRAAERYRTAFRAAERAAAARGSRLDELDTSSRVALLTEALRANS